MTPHEHHGHDGGDLLPWEEHRRNILATIEPLPPLELSLREAFGCVLAKEVRATGDIPSFASSAMDGFAVRSEDVAKATEAHPAALAIIGEVEMGRSPGVAVQSGAAARIPTGGAVPEGADAIAPIEDCRVDGSRVLVLRPAPPGRHVRPAGQDVRAGRPLLDAGTRLLGPQLGLLAAAGRGTVLVHPVAHVLVASTGDELVELGQSAEMGQIYDANGVTLYGAVRETGAEPLAGGILRDEPQALWGLERNAFADVFITSGGVSVGERDPVKAAFREEGEVRFYRLAMQPGMPQAFGRLGGRLFFGLPGNPVSVFVSFELFVRPAILALMGRRDLFRPEISCRLEGDIEGLPQKTRFARVSVRRTEEGVVAAPTGGPQSNLLSTVARANGLAIIPAGTEVVRAGEECRVMLVADVES